MSKKLLVIIAGVLIAVIVCGLLTLLVIRNGKVSGGDSNDMSTSTASGAWQCVQDCASFDEGQYATAEDSLQGDKTYADPTASSTVTLKLLTDSAHQAQNPELEVYVNGKDAGEIVGQAISQATFSPDHKYFAFRARVFLGGTDQASNLYVVDLDRPLVMQLLIRPGISSANESVFTESDTFIQSYTWGSSASITATAFSVGHADSGDYRVSAIQQWSFNLNNPQSVMRNGVVSVSN